MRNSPQQRSGEPATLPASDYGELVLGEHKLRHGDTLQIGPLVLEVLLDAEPVNLDNSINDTSLVDQDETARPQPGISETREQLPIDEKPVSSI
jgi:predicted component of type VI protein secretion system